MDDESYQKIINGVRTRLNEKSPSLCLAKWLQVTIHFQNGLTHSCHHPPTHKIPLKELEGNPSALHNTKFKKSQRKAMLKGSRPAECDYCWRIEDSGTDVMSDRTFKSADSWALPHFNEVADKPWDQDIAPTYVEVSFGNECQFKCSYCSPTVSSGILSEFHKFGHYKVQNHFALDHLKATNQYPYSKDEYNPYVEAFWKWWPTLSQKLEVFRITGGEPLLNPNTFKFLEKIIEQPMPNLDLAINSNLSVPEAYLKKFLSLSSTIVEKKLVKKFQVYTSVDTLGPQAEYIRFGLNYDQLITNIKIVLDTLPGIQVIIMCTFNVLSIPKFEDFLKSVALLKRQYIAKDLSSRVELSISYLRHPTYMAANIIPREYIHYIEKALDFMMRNHVFGEGFDYYQIFSQYEMGQLRRILDWIRSEELNESQLKDLRQTFYTFFKEYDERKGTSLINTFPEFETFFKEIELSFTE